MSENLDSSDKKYVYGSLADTNMADKITQEMNQMNIECHYFTDDQGLHHLYVLKKEDLNVAIDHFRVLIGFKKPIEISKEWVEIKKLPLGNFTFGILLICILIYFFGYFMQYEEVYNFLMFGPREQELTFSLIENGEYWRLFTPALIHFGLLHILFNLMWWKDLGNILENTKGALFLCLFLIVTAVFSNLLQAYMSGPNFGGISGVIYALCGYLWIYKVIIPEAKFYLPKSDIVLMFGWLVLCMFDIFSFKAANWAHGGGLVMGVVFGIIMAINDKSKSHKI